MTIHIKRVYEKPEKSDGTRILVDRLWPRGLTKEKARIDSWLKEIAPSKELRQWFGHEAVKWPEFRKRYRKELKENRAAIKHIRELAKKGTITLVYGAKDTQHNDAVVVMEYLK